jgi:hypothetical protein
MDRVIAIVVQPGVEFGTENVIAYNPYTASALTGVLHRHPGLVFEAHSTDYQSDASLTVLARDGFALLKVGPALTFALRETVYCLDALLAALAPNANRTRLPDVMERLMLRAPEHWQGHYHGDGGPGACCATTATATASVTTGIGRRRAHASEARWTACGTSLCRRRWRASFCRGFWIVLGAVRCP